MKKLKFLLILILISSCGNNSNNLIEEKNKLKKINKELEELESLQDSLERIYEEREKEISILKNDLSNKKSDKKHNENKNYIIDDLEVYPYDLDKIHWSEARRRCENIGFGWRLPTMDELELMYNNKYNIKGFKEGNYWSSEIGNYKDTGVKCLYFPYGSSDADRRNEHGPDQTNQRTPGSVFLNKKEDKCRVRAVRKIP
jgi:hypothetical protein